jgi:hypothetical protein
MEYRITARSNRKVPWIFLIIAALPGAGIASFWVLHPALAAVVTLVGGFFAWNFLKLVRSILSSRIITGDDAISFDFGKGHVDEFAWDEITHAGLYREPSGERALFVYREETDRLVTVPTEYEAFEELVSEVKRGTGERFEVIDIGSRSTINDYLRARLAPSADESDDEFGTDDSDDDFDDPDTETDPDDPM